jgi:hypothetical protein
VDVRRLYVAGALGAATACTLPPAVQFFTPVPSGWEIVAPLTDTVLVRRYGAPDSVSSDGVHLAYDVLDRAEAAGRPDVAETIRRVLDAVPPGGRERSRDPGAQEGDIVRRVQARDRVSQMDLMRADGVTIQEVTADTVHADGEWLALILVGVATLDPATGRR